MKVLIVSLVMSGGGAERVAAILAEGLAERNHNVTLAFAKSENEYALNPKIKIFDQRPYFKDTYKGSILERVYNKVANRFVRSFKYIKHLLKEEEPDVVISFMRAHSVPLLLYCHGKTPLIFSEHNNFNKVVTETIPKLRRFIFYFDRDHLIKYADAVTILTYYDNAFLGDKLKNRVVMYNPLTFAPLEKERYDELFPKRKHLLACGRVSGWWQKGFDNLIKSFALIAYKYPDWNLDIAGKGGPKDMEMFKSLITQYHLEGRVNMLGFRNDMKELMQNHSIYVLSSRFEGLPMVLEEAMSNGMACVAFDCISGPNEIIVNTIDGLLAENQDNQSLADAIGELIENKEMRYQFGLHAIEDIKRFSADKIVDKWEKLFEKVTAKYAKKS